MVIHHTINIPVSVPVTFNYTMKNKFLVKNVLNITGTKNRKNQPLSSRSGFFVFPSLFWNYLLDYFWYPRYEN